uniref:Uncharacterized protein n=1 Tax=Anguilla anguilla TaxID=7936 RepID=A0A0E9RIE6_ANGAN
MAFCGKHTEYISYKELHLPKRVGAKIQICMVHFCYFIRI